MQISIRHPDSEIYELVLKFNGVFQILV